MEESNERSEHGIFATTFLMLFLAEMGKNTQLAVAGMAGCGYRAILGSDDG